jgi:hypothetical protein
MRGEFIDEQRNQRLDERAAHPERHGAKPIRTGARKAQAVVETS